LTQGREGSDKATAKTSLCCPIAPLSGAASGVKSNPARTKHIHQLSDGHETGRVDARYWKQIDDHITKTGLCIFNGAKQLPLEMGSIEKGDRRIEANSRMPGRTLAPSCRATEWNPGKPSTSPRTSTRGRDTSRMNRNSASITAN